MSAVVHTMRSIIAAPFGASGPRHQSACASVTGLIDGPAVDRPWHLGVDKRNGAVPATTPTRPLGSRST